jgi:hypothetical protein
MRIRNSLVILLIFIFGGCASIPKETVLLSQTIGKDLQVLHRSHQNMVEFHFRKIKTDINTFVDDVYAPFVIHFVLKKELESFKNGDVSLYGTIEIVGQKADKSESENAINAMADFQNAARKQIERKRNELLYPILKQEESVLESINRSYEQVSYANTTITFYLKSLRKLKDTQEEALSVVGLDGINSLITHSLVDLSDQVDMLVKKGKEIDVKSDNAYKKLEDLSEKIKSLSILK